MASPRLHRDNTGTTNSRQGERPVQLQSCNFGDTHVLYCGVFRAEHKTDDRETSFTHHPSPFPQPPPHTHHLVSTFPGSTHEPLTPVLPTGIVVVAFVAVACLGFRCIPSIWKPFRSPTVRQLLSKVETVQIWQTSVWILAPAYTSHMIFSKLTYLCIPQFLPLYAEVIINKS